MSIYNLLPSADIACKENLHAFWENGFSQDEVMQIIQTGQSKLLNDATIGESGNVSDIRRSRVSWLAYNDIGWLYDKMGHILRQLNGQYFQADVTGFAEDFQYTVYDGQQSSYYDWHMDKGCMTANAPRKLSMILMLSDPSEYEGGDVELCLGNNTELLRKDQGIVHVFPSYVIHRVTPVTKGTRRSLVVWSCGPKWR